MKNSRGSSRRSWIAAAAAVAAVAVTASASLGGIGPGKGVQKLHEGQYGKKAVVCHKGRKSIRISVRALPAHKRHGDFLGECRQAVRAKHGKHGRHEKHDEHGKKDKGAGQDTPVAAQVDGDAAQVTPAGESDEGSARVDKHGKSAGKAEDRGGRGESGKGKGKH